jgi:putative hydrolase of HD superfamily
VADATEPELGRPADLGLPAAQESEVAFLVRAHGLAEVARLNRLVSDARPESSAEHSWHLALCAMVLDRYAGSEVDRGRVMQMLVIHDLVEVVTGDVVIYDEQARIDVATLEEQAADELFGSLPDPTGNELRRLWREFEEGRTHDARFARALDRLQPILMHWAGAGQAWASRRVTLDQELAIVAKVEHFAPPLGDLARRLVTDAVNRGLLIR